MEFPYTRCMESDQTVFGMFGGIRPMARALSESPATVQGWKKNGRIPAEKQPHVLAVGEAMDLPITAEHVVYPLGRPDAVTETLAAIVGTVVCDRQSISQRKDVA